MEYIYSGSLNFFRTYPDLGMEPGSLALQADSLPTQLSGKPLTFFRAFKY